MKLYKSGILCMLLFSVAVRTEMLEHADLVLIPGGWFEMGSTVGGKDERPVHKVHVDSFYMGRSEVTVWEYLECVEDGGCDLPSWWNQPFFNSIYAQLSGHEWLKLPIVGVSWDDAQKFCAWKGENYRLPTEAEWEFAARAGSAGKYPWGDISDSAEEYAVIGERMNPVMSRRPNSFDLYDMVGNAWEWCSDYYSKDYTKMLDDASSKGAERPRRQRLRVVRGGAWNEYIWNLRTANRSYGEQNRRYDSVGFRICK